MNGQDDLRGLVEGAVGGILDVLAEAVTVRAPSGEVIYANRRALANMGMSTMHELRSREIRSVFDDYVVQDEHGNALTMDELPSVRLLGGQEPEPMLIRTIGRDTGEIHWELLKSTPLRDEGGRVVAAVTVIEDVTAEKEAQLRADFLAAATETLMSSLDYQETLRNVGWLAVPGIADWCAVDLLDEHGLPRRVVVAHRDAEKLQLAEALERYAPRVPNPEAGLGKVLRTGVAELIADVRDEQLVQAAVDEEHLRMLRAVGFRSVLLVPLRARGRSLGALTLVSAESRRRFDLGDRELAEQLAQRAAMAVDNARLATAQRAVAETLQRSLMPREVPAIPGWEIATFYAAAGSDDGVQVGGDFFDFVETPGGWLALLGDVTGRGLAASAMTLLVRHGARFLGRNEPSPAAILEGVNEALRDQPELSLCSAVCARLEPGGFVLSSAGHPSPLLLRASGEVVELGQTGPILGAWPGRWRDRTVPVAEGDTLFIYTDGLTELQGRAERFGPERLSRLLSSCRGASPGELLAELQLALEAFSSEEQSDDTAAVALRFAAA